MNMSSFELNATAAFPPVSSPKRLHFKVCGKKKGGGDLTAHSSPLKRKGGLIKTHVQLEFCTGGRCAAPLGQMGFKLLC